MENKTVTAPRGFLAAGVAAGIKKSGKPDLALLVCPTGATAAAMFTTNTIVSSAVTISKKHVSSSKIEAVVVNSGNANACTGKLGLKNAIKMCAQTAAFLDTSPRQILVASTGIIGNQLPMPLVTSGITKACAKLSASPQAGIDFSTAIMTTDTVRKQACFQLKIGSRTLTIAATTKGAGMIAPNLATTLCFITTDVAISKPLLQKALRAAIGDSLNKLTVDGHQSTNDTAIILASGLAGNPPIKTPNPAYSNFTKALIAVCDDLARQMAHDAEGATRIFKVIIKGAASKSDAAKAARAVADYPLVKCAVHGADPNWGRIICAVGSCGVKLAPARLSCKLGTITVFRNGAPAKFDVKKASAIVGQREHTITVDLGAGKHTDFCYGCDLGRGYITINADYHT